MSTTFLGSDLKIAWDVTPPSDWVVTSGADWEDPYLRDYRIRLLDSTGVTVYGTWYTRNRKFVLSKELNREATGSAPLRDFKIGIAMRDKSLNVYTEGLQEFVNPAPAAPTVTLTANTNGFTISVSKCTDTDYAGTKVWVSVTNGFTVGVTTPNFDAPQTNFTYVTGTATTYYVRVAHYDDYSSAAANLNLSSQASVTVTFGPVDTVPPSPPTSVVTSSTTSIDADGHVVPVINVTWTPPGDADLDHFLVKVAQTAGPTTIYTTKSAPYQIVVLAGVGYSVSVAAVDNSGNVSTYATDPSHTPITAASDTTVPSNPTSIAASGVFTFAIISWINSSDADLSGVQVYENTTNTSSGSMLVATVKSAASSPGYFVRGGLTTGVTRWYFLKSIDQSGNVNGSYTSGVSATTITIGRIDVGPFAITASKIQGTDTSQSHPDVDFIDPDAFTTQNSAAGTVTTSVDATNVLGTLSAPQGVVHVALGALSANSTFYRTQPIKCKGGIVYNARLDQINKVGFRGQGQLRIRTLASDGVTVLTSTIFTGTDFTLSPVSGSDVVETITGSLTTDATAAFMTFDARCLWPSTGTVGAGTLYQANPILRRAVSIADIGSLTSSQLATLLTDETGTAGFAVFSNAPSFTGLIGLDTLTTLSFNADAGISRTGVGVLNVGDGTWGTNTGTLNATRYNVKNATSGFFLGLLNGDSTATATRALTINLNDTARTVSLSGNLTVSSTATISGTNTGDQTISLTSDVTGSGTGSFATTVAKIQGTTVSGTTGSGNVVFSASPSLTGTVGLASAALLNWSTDTGFSRTTTGKLALGNGTAGDESGTLQATAFNLFNATSTFDLTIRNTDSTATAQRQLSLVLNDLGRIINLAGNLTVSSTATISGTNTGDQTISLTSDVTGSGTGSFATTVAKIQGTTVSGTTGTVNVVFSASPTLTGTIGAASMTLSGTLNKVTITQPATAATLTILNNKTATVNNTLTFAGTDGTTMTFPAASDTVAGLGTTQSFTAAQTFNQALTYASGTNATLDDVNVAAATTTVTGTTAITNAKGFNKVSIYKPTITDSSSVTITNSATFFVEDAPGVSGSATITNAYSIWAKAGIARFGGGLLIDSGTLLSWNSDTGFSRTAGAQVALGNGTATDRSGVLKLTGVNLLNATSTFELLLRNTDSAATAARTLSINLNDTGRTVSLSGNLTVSAGSTISGNFTVASGKTLTASNTLTLTGTDSTSFAFPAASDTVACLGTVQTFSAAQLFSIVTTVASASGAILDDFKVGSNTTTITGSTNITTVAGFNKNSFKTPTYSAGSALTITNAATVYIQNAPTGGGAGPATITNAYALWVQAGTTRIGGNLLIDAGTTTQAPINLTSGTNLTSAVAGAFEYDGKDFYTTIDTTAGRGVVPSEQQFRLTATGSTISTIANYFGTTSNISLVASGEYEIEIECYFLKSTAGTVTWTFTNSSAPTGMNVHLDMSPATGITSTPASDIVADLYNQTTTAPTLVTPTLTTAVNHYARFKIYLINGSGTSLKIQATCSAGTITPGIGSNWRARRLPAANVGTFAA